MVTQQDPEYPAPAAWWDQIRLETGETGRWHIGPLTLLLRRLEQEWQIGWHSTENTEGDSNHWEFSVTDQAPADEKEFERYVFKRTEPQVVLVPTLGDRPLVMRPAAKLFIPPGQQATLFIGLPLWAKVMIGKQAITLKEVPLLRPSDTWFGPSTLDGQLCYATRSQGRLRLEELSRRVHRAITPLVVQNQDDELMPVERISLPVVNLPLFGEADGMLWTPTVTMVREQGGDTAALKIGSAAPRHAMRSKLIAEPREKPDKRTMVQALGTLFG